MIEETLSASAVAEDAVANNTADPAAPPLEWLETQICELADPTAATYRFLVLLGDFDERRGWAEWDLPSCAAWLSWKCQLTSGTAREHVRVARAHSDAAGAVGGVRRGPDVVCEDPGADPDRDSGHRRRPGRAGRADDGQPARAIRQRPPPGQPRRRRIRRRDAAAHLAAGRGRLAGADGPPAASRRRRRAAGPARRDRRPRPPGASRRSTRPPTDVSAETPVTPASLADALVEIAGAFLAGKIETASNPDIYQVIVHVGTEALTAEPHAGVSAETPIGHPADPSRCHIEDGPAISPATAQAIACCATVSWMLHDHKGNPLDVGRRHRRRRQRCGAPSANAIGTVPVPRLQLPQGADSSHQALGQGRQDQAA